MAAVSVLVATRNPGKLLPDLVRTVDAQTLPTAEFELVVVDASTDGSATRLEQLAGRRPNVTMLSADAKAAEADRLALAVERATGEYVLVVGQQQRLAPRALELLLDQARRTGADLVLGRVVSGTTSGSAVLPDDADRLEPPDADVASCVAFVRRSLDAGRSSALLDPAGLVREAGSVSAVGRYACSTRGAVRASAAQGVSVESTAYRWDAGMLHLTIRVRLPAPGSRAVRAWVVAAQGPAEVALPATVEPAGTEGTEGVTSTVSAAFDPRTAEGGHPLQDGPWDLRLRLAWPDHEVTAPLVPEQRRSAVLEGRPYVVGRAGEGVQLDAGATRSSVIGPVPESRATVVETVRGALVTLDYPSLHVHGDATLDARLLLDGFGLPGRLICEHGRARLEAYASSLAGSHAVAVVAGGGRPVPTGLRMRFDGTGRMTLQRDAPSGSGGASGGPLVQRLRRRLPGALEPVAQRLVQVPTVRRAYQRLLNR